MAFAAFAYEAAQQWKPSLRATNERRQLTFEEYRAAPPPGVALHQAQEAMDGGNNPEVPSPRAERPTGPAWQLLESWIGPPKHYSQKAFKDQQSNVKFGKAREDIQAYAQSVEPFTPINDEMFRVPFFDMTNFVQTLVQICCAPSAVFKLRTKGIGFAKKVCALLSNGSHQARTLRCERLPRCPRHTPRTPPP